jgi:hypothetical protein
MYQVGGILLKFTDKTFRKATFKVTQAVQVHINSTNFISPKIVVTSFWYQIFNSSHSVFCNKGFKMTHQYAHPEESPELKSHIFQPLKLITFTFTFHDLSPFKLKLHQLSWKVCIYIYIPKEHLLAVSCYKFVHFI